LHLELAERPEHPFTLFNLGMTYADIGEFAQAADYLKRSRQHSEPGDSHVRKVYALLVQCHAGMGNHAAALDSCLEGLGHFPKDAELLFRKALLLHDAGRLEEAAQAYRHLLETDEPAHFKSVVKGLRGFLGRHNLALVYQDMGHWARALEQWRLVVQEAPDYRAGWQGLHDALVHEGKCEEARAIGPRLSR
jgi:tetratricopeptide (TPR) repeat protein